MNTSATILALLLVYIALIALSGFIGGYVLAVTVGWVLALPIGILALLAWLEI